MCIIFESYPGIDGDDGNNSDALPELLYNYNPTGF
jgi:hypothetical protein